MNNRGVTLIECVTAILLMGMLITAMVFSFATARMYAAYARHSYTAINFARESMEITTQAGITVGDSAPSDESVVIDPRTTASGDELYGTMSHKYSINATSLTAYVTVEVAWTEGFWQAVAKKESIACYLNAQAAAGG